MPEFLLKIIAPAVWRLARWWMVHSPDWYVALHLKLARRLVFAVTGDEFLRDVVTELVDIFEGGGREAKTARLIFQESDRGFPVAVIKAALRRD